MKRRERERMQKNRVMTVIDLYTHSSYFYIDPMRECKITKSHKSSNQFYVNEGYGGVYNNN